MRGMRLGRTGAMLVVAASFMANPAGAVPPVDASGRVGDAGATGATTDTASEATDEGEPAPAASSKRCQPACRSGYVCVDGACVSACNPPCDPGQRCTDTGECEPDSATVAQLAEQDHSVGLEPKPEPADEPESKTERRSTGALTTGIVLTIVGGGGILYGSVVFAGSSSEDCEGGRCPFLEAGGAYLVLGGAIMAVGIPLILFGSTEVPVEKGRTRTRREARLLLGGNSVGLQLTW